MLRLYPHMRRGHRGSAFLCCARCRATRVLRRPATGPGQAPLDGACTGTTRMSATEASARNCRFSKLTCVCPARRHSARHRHWPERSIRASAPCGVCPSQPNPRLPANSSCGCNAVRTPAAPQSKPEASSAGMLLAKDATCFTQKGGPYLSIPSLQGLAPGVQVHHFGKPPGDGTGSLPGPPAGRAAAAPLALLAA